MTALHRALAWMTIAFTAGLVSPALADEEPPASVIDAIHAAGGSALWVEASPSPALNAKGQAVALALSRAAREGLKSEDYALADGGSAEELDRSVTASLLRYLTDLQAGRIAPKEADPDLFVFRREVDGGALLGRVHAAENPERAIADLAPANPIYRRLRRLLLDYRTIAAEGGWRTVPDGETLKPGMRDARIHDLRRRLAVSRDISPTGNEDDLYDPALESAVRQFQRRHGLDADGAVGAKTLAALNLPVETRIRQIVLNMERFRWMPDDFGDDHVFVNMAGFELDYVVGGVTRLAMRVVVGRQFRETPIFSDRIRYLEFNPTWTVPPRIAVNDLLPKIRKDPSFLASGGYEVFAGWQNDSPRLDPTTIDWSAAGKGKFPYRLRQAPGEQNALGQVKFMFPNKFDVYLHDTPARELFRRSVRAFSSGCIRLERPIDLARAMLEADGQDPTRVTGILDSRKTGRVNLATPVPVHLTYLTAWIGEGGTVEFRDDVYGRDALLAKALGL